MFQGAVERGRPRAAHRPHGSRGGVVLVGGFCPTCGAAVAGGAGFCGQCGGRLTAEAAGQAAAPLGGFWRRFLAYVLDGVIASIAGEIVGLALHDVFVGSLIVTVVYWIGTVGAWQQTLGMRILGLRVVPSTERVRVSWADSLVRYLMMIVGGLCFGLGFLWAAWDPQRQTWHDHVAKTLVVSARA